MTISRSALLVLGLAMACKHDKDEIDDSSGGGGGGDDTNIAIDSGMVPPVQHNALLANLASDYSVGALSTIGLDGWEIDDNITTTSSDPAVRVTGELVVQMNRGTDNSIRIYRPGNWSAPTVEFSTGDGSNPHDAELCGDELFVALYGTDYLGVYDPESGALLGKVDLSAYDDGDGYPEVSALLRVDDKLYVSMEQLDQNNGWVANGGAIAEVDCASRAVTQSWEPGPGPSIYEYPPEPGKLVVRTGVYFDSAGDFAWDGGLFLLDPAANSLTEMGVNESDLEVNLSGFVATASGHALLLSTDATWAYNIHCLDLNSGDITTAESVPQYLATMAINDRGEAWIGARTSWAAPDDPGGVIVYDVDTCSAMTGDTWLSMTLEPYSIAFY